MGPHNYDFQLNLTVLEIICHEMNEHSLNFGFSSVDNYWWSHEVTSHLPRPLADVLYGQTSVFAPLERRQQ